MQRYLLFSRSRSVKTFAASPGARPSSSLPAASCATRAASRSPLIASAVACRYRSAMRAALVPAEKGPGPSEKGPPARTGAFETPESTNFEVIAPFRPRSPAFEIRCRGDSTGGSNPSSSASGQCSRTNGATPAPLKRTGRCLARALRSGRGHNDEVLMTSCRGG